ncbi:MAG: hypothetical protein IKT15_02845 [Firmicutes bacterium]|nr:hypothetical protein [Bacillota bacterium]MBR6503893.1 hypothetical protein [Bacillota bacterium]
MEKENNHPEEIIEEIEEVVIEEEIVVEEPAEEEPEVIIGTSKIRGVAVNSKDLEKATEDYPIVLNVYEDFFPVHPGDPVKAPQDAVVPMDKIQIIGPMIRIIEYFEPMTNIEPIEEEQGE